MSKKNAPPPAQEIAEDLPPDHILLPAQQPLLPEEKPLSALKKMRRVNALTAILSNKDFLQVMEKVDEGEYLLEIFSKAIEDELEKMFQGNTGKIKDSLAGLLNSVDTAYAKAQAIASSPVQAVLERLLVNLGGSNPEISAPPSVSTPLMPSRRRGEGGISGY